MIPATCKRLIEVDFPIAKVSEYSALEKSGPTGHISTIHLWWARRPLAACRSVLLGLLLPDPCDKDCPAAFKTNARGLLAKRFSKRADTDETLREMLIEFIGEFASWDFAADSTYLEIGRGLIKAAHPNETPVVVDPFSGGGSIPLEALRLGCEAFASDLNPVACLILKTLLEDIPRYCNAEFKLKDDKGKEITIHGLADALRHVGKQVRQAAEIELSKFYPPNPDGSHPIAYIWSRTVRCEGIGCGAEIPLIRSLWLCKKSNRKRALRYRIERIKNNPPKIIFELFEPKNEKEVSAGTVNRANATCPCCHIVLPAARVRSQLSTNRGGADVQFDAKGNRIGGALLLAVITVHEKATGKGYRLSTPDDYVVVYEAQKIVENLPKGVVPDERLPLMSGTFNVPLYGIKTWGDMFTSRQKMALLVWQRLLINLGKSQMPGCLLEAMSLALSRVTMCGMSLTNWNAFAEKMQHTFGRQAIPMVWDFAEVVSTAHAPGAWQNAMDLICDVVSKFPPTPIVGQVQQADVCESPLSKGTSDVWFTDPPYYFAVPYADLSDFFFVWLKRTLPNHPLLRDPFDKENPLTPKDRELCQMAHWDSARYAHKDQRFFEDGMARAFAEGRRVLKEDGICCVVFAHKTTEGWEALLSGMIRGGWAIKASWPISTEMASRLRARESAALGSSVHLVCRPRHADAGIGDWTEVKTAMEKRIREWLPTLVKHGIRGADAIFSCLGPALESYSKFEKVLTAGDREVPLGGNPDSSEPHERGFLAYIFETLSKEALRQVLGDADTEGFEEDSRMTALFLWTLQATKSNGNGSKKSEQASVDEEDTSDDEGEDGDKPKKAKAGFTMPFDTFIRITRPMGIHYPTLENRVIEIEKGIVRLLAVKERSQELLGEVAERSGIEFSLEDVKQLELGIVERKRAEADLPLKSKKGKKAAASGQIQEVSFTTLDRIHRAMLLFSMGRSTLLRQVLETELKQSKRFERLAMALNALYPDGSDERRMLEGVQSAMRGIR
jgi:putative DNA methylase